MCWKLPPPPVQQCRQVGPAQGDWDTRLGPHGWNSAGTGERVPLSLAPPGPPSLLPPMLGHSPGPSTDATLDLGLPNIQNHWPDKLLFIINHQACGIPLQQPKWTTKPGKSSVRCLGRREVFLILQGLRIPLPCSLFLEAPGNRFTLRRQGDQEGETRIQVNTDSTEQALPSRLSELSLLGVWRSPGKLGVDSGWYRQLGGWNGSPY